MSGTVTCDNLFFRNTGNFDVSSQDVAAFSSFNVWEVHPGKTSVTLSGTGVWLLTGYWAIGASGSAIWQQFCVSKSATAPPNPARDTAMPIDTNILYYLSKAYGSGTAVDSMSIFYTINNPGTYYFYVGGYPLKAAYRLTLTKIA